MACMEHVCHHCDFVEFNNKAGSPFFCPKCGYRLQHIWDEEDDYRRERDLERRARYEENWDAPDEEDEEDES